MALERALLAIAPVAFTADGTQFGVVTVADTIGFKDKQTIILQSNTQPQTNYQVKRVLSSTQLIVGPNNNALSPSPPNISNVSAFKVADHATISAGEQQKTSQPTEKDHYFAIYESSPINADRVIPVDPYGNLIGPDNPLAVKIDGPINIGEVEVIGSNGNILEPNPDGSLNVNIVETPVTGQTVKSTYGAAAIASMANGIVVTYTVPAGKTAIFQKANASGENVAQYTVLYNSAIFDLRRTMFGGDLTTDFDYITGNNNGLTLSSGDVIAIQVLNSRPTSANFNGRIQVLEIA